MRRTGSAAVLLVAVAALLVLPPQTQAQTVETLVNNISKDTNSTVNVGGTDNVRQAQKFTVPTGQNYSLADVTIGVGTRGGDGIVVSIRDGSDDNPPGTALYVLIPPASPGTGNEVYTAPAGAVLEGGNDYFVVLERAQNTGTTNALRATLADTESGETGWEIANSRRERSGGSWSNKAHALKIRIRGSFSSFSTPPPHNEIWSTTLTVEPIIAGGLQGYGFLNVTGAGSLSQEEFTYYGTEYSILLFYLNTDTDPDMLIGLSPQGGTAFDNEELSLVIDDTTFSFGDAELNSTGQWVWADSGLNWADGDVVEVRLLGPLPPPVALVTATVSGTALALTYDTGMDTTTVPAASAFTVEVDGTAATVSSVAVAGPEVTLTLGSAPASTVSTTVGYVVPATNPLRSLPGAEAPAFSGQAVTHTGDLVSNRSKPEAVGRATVGSAISFLAAAQMFSTGGNAAGYRLDSVNIDVEGVDANADPRISIYTPSGSDPGTLVHTLSNPTSLADGWRTFTAPPGALLGKNTDYFVVLEHTRTTGQFAITVTSSNAEDSGKADGWDIANTRRTSSNGTWGAPSNSDVIRIQVQGDIVPNRRATGTPAITGTAAVGRTLTAVTADISDPDGTTKAKAGDTGYAYTYQWIRVDSDGSSNATDISGATASTYVLASTDENKKIKVEVELTDDADTDEGPLTSAAYPPTGKVAAAATDVEVPYNWSLNPTGLSTGDKFRLIFLSSTKTNATSADIADYNRFIQTRAAAGHADIQTYSAGFQAVGCTATTAATANTDTTGTGVVIHWLNGNKVADDYADFYDGSWDDEANDKNEDGTNGPDTSLSANYPYTGCADNGTESTTGTTSFALGSPDGSVRVGRPNSSQSVDGPIESVSSAGPTFTRPMYGLSQVFEVAADHNIAATGTPSIGGTPQVGMVLRAAKGTIADDNGTTKADNGDTGYAYSYQWLRVDADGVSNETNIGSDAATYTPVAADVGKKVKVTVSFTDDGNTDEARTSNAYPSSGTITAATQPQLSFPLASVMVNEGDGSVTLTVELDPASTGTVTVDFATSDQSALAGVDYTATSGTLTFAASETSKTITVPILNDTAYDPVQRFRVTLSNASGATLPASPWAFVNITNNDAVPTASIANVTASEGDGTLTLTMALDRLSTGDISYSATTEGVSGTATVADDYVSFLPGGSVNFTVPAGAMSATFDITLVDDSLDETNETISIVWSKFPNHDATPTSITVTGTITDNDTALPVLSFASDEVTVDEDAGPVTLTVELDPASTGTVTVDYATRDFSAKAGEDYTTTSGTLTFAAGQTSKEITVPILDDDAYERDEAFHVDLTNPSGATVPASTAQIRIDSEEAVPTASMANVTVGEGAGTMTLTLRLSHPSQYDIAYLTGAVNVTGTATEGDDYDDFLLEAGRTAKIALPGGSLSRTLDITLVDDGVDEPDEMIVIGWRESATDDVTPGFFTFTGTITDNDTTGVTLSRSTLTVTEEDTTGDSYTVVLDSQPAANVTVTVAGHAGTDVTVTPTTLTFTSTTWNTPQPVTVTAADDADAVNDSVTLTHSAASSDANYNGITIASVTVTVSDNEGSNNAPVFVDGASTTREFSETVGGTPPTSGSPVGQPVAASDADNDPLEYSLEGADADLFTVASGTGQIQTLANTLYDYEAQQSYAVVVTVEDDNGTSDTIDVTLEVVDQLETPRRVSQPTITTLGTTSLRVSWMAPENAGQPTITGYDVRHEKVGVSGSSTQRVTGTSVTLTGLEPDTQLFADVKAVNADGPGQVWSAPGSGRTDPVLVTFGASSYTAAEAGAAVTVTVALSEAMGSSTTIPLTRTNRDGATDADYSGVPPNVTFGASQTSTSFTVTAVDDSDNDRGESVRIGFGTLPSGVAAGSPATATVVLEDDDAWRPPTVSFGAATYTATEGGGAVTVTVEVDRAEVPFTLPLTRDGQGGATSSDYSGVPSSVVFRGSDTVKSFTVTAVDDEVDDDGESVVIGFGAPLPAGLSLRTGSPSQTRVRLVDNDVPAAQGALRLVGGDGSYGRLQVYHDDRWGLVCDTNFDDLGAGVACRQLGFVDGEEGFGGAGSGGLPFWLTSVECDGTESRLVDCSHPGLQEYSCGSFHIVGVECSRTPLSMAAARVDGPLLTVRYNAALDSGSVPSGGDFVVLAGPAGGASAVPVTSVSVYGDRVALTLARPVLPDETVRLSYLVAPMHPLRDASGGHAAAQTDMAVRNETPPLSVDAADAVVSLAEIDGPAAANRPSVDLSHLLADAGASAPLGRLDLSSRGLGELTMLSGLTELRVLNLGHNEILDLAPLAGLTRLRVLDLSSNAVADLTPLAALTGLERLNLSGNRIADVSALSGLVGLEVLLLDGNRVDDMLPLWSLQRLVNLGLSDNRIADIRLLAELGALKRLDLSGNVVSDISPLGNLSELVWLRLPGNPISDAAPLGRLTHLRWLWLDLGVDGLELLNADARGAPLWVEWKALPGGKEAIPQN